MNKKFLFIAAICLAGASINLRADFEGPADVSIPIKWAGVAGSPSIDNPAIVGEATVKDVLWRRHERISEFRLIPTCNVTLRSAAFQALPNFPVIADPAAVGMPGDINLGAAVDNFDEFDDAIDAARTAWTALGFSAGFGMTAVSINQFVDNTGTRIGVLGLGGWSPTTCDAAIQAIIGRAMIEDRSVSAASDPNEIVFGQELLHGAALEDGSWAADPAHNPDNGNLMFPFFPNGGALTAAQCTRLRDQVIAHVPGVMVDPVPEPFMDMRSDRRRDVDLPLVDIHNSGIARATGLKQTHLFLDTYGCLNPNDQAQLSYAFMLDTDDNPNTGGAPVEVGVPVDARGFDVVARLNVQGNAKELSWQFFRYREGAFRLIDDKRVRGEIHCHYIVVMMERGDIHRPGGQIAEIIVPDDLLPDIGVKVRYLTLVRDLQRQIIDTTEQLHLTFRNPTYPTCTITPRNIVNGGTVRIQAEGLVPNQKAHILLGPNLISEAATDASGKLDVNLALTLPTEPETAAFHLITIGTEETAITADCTVNIGPERGKAPPPGSDYSNSQAILTLNGQSVPVSGPTLIERGQAVRDPQGRIMIPVEMQAACLEGEAPGLGKVRVQIGHRFGLRKTVGRIVGGKEELFPADSFFDVFAKIEMENVGSFCNEDAIRMGAEIISIPPCGTSYFAGTQTIIFKDCCTGQTTTNIVHVQHQLTCSGAPLQPPIIEKQSCIVITGNATGGGRVALNLVKGTDCSQVLVSSGDVGVTPGQSPATTAALLAAGLQRSLISKPGCDFDVTVSGNVICIKTRGITVVECCLRGTSLAGNGQILGTRVNLGQTFNKSENSTTFPDPRCIKGEIFAANTFPPLGTYATVDNSFVSFKPIDELDIIIRRFRHPLFPIPPIILKKPPVCLSCPPDIFEFITPIEFEVMVGESEWNHVRTEAFAKVQVSRRPDLGGFQLFDTELVDLQIRGGLPQGMSVRQSRQNRSLGQLSMMRVKGGFQESSFFDVFLELQFENKVAQASGPVHLELTREPATAQERFVKTDTFPPRGRYEALINSTLDFGFIITRRYRHPIWRIPDIIIKNPPCLQCPPIEFPIEAPIEFELSLDRGKSFRRVGANAKMDVIVQPPQAIGGFLVYDAQVLRLDVAGGDLPAGAMLRLNPEEKSVGRTTLRQVEGGFMLSSTFDLCVQATVDGGKTFMSAAGPSHLEFTTRPFVGILKEPNRLLLSWDGPDGAILERGPSIMGPWARQDLPPNPPIVLGSTETAFYRFRTGEDTSPVAGLSPLNLPHGFSMIANQFDAPETTIASLLPNPPDGTQLYKFDPESDRYATYLFDELENAWLPNGDATLMPGEGAFIRNNGAGALPLLFSGDVLEGELELPLEPGFSIVSSMLPKAGTATELGFPADDGDQLYLFSSQTQSYQTFLYDALEQRWLPSEPQIGVGQSFFIRKNESDTWVQTFVPEQ